MPDTRAGHEGHAGIARLDERFGTKAQRKDLRAKLARVAAVSVLDVAVIDRLSANDGS